MCFHDLWLNDLPMTFCLKYFLRTKEKKYMCNFIFGVYHRGVTNINKVTIWYAQQSLGESIANGSEAQWGVPNGPPLFPRGQCLLFLCFSLVYYLCMCFYSINHRMVCEL